MSENESRLRDVRVAITSGSANGEPCPGGSDKTHIVVEELLAENGLEPLALVHAAGSDLLFAAAEKSLGRKSLVMVRDGAPWKADVVHLFERSGHALLAEMRYALQEGNTRVLVFDWFNGNPLCTIPAGFLKPEQVVEMTYQLAELACYIIDRRQLVPVFEPHHILLDEKGRIRVLWLAAATQGAPGWEQVAECMESLTHTHRILRDRILRTVAMPASRRRPKVTPSEEAMVRLAGKLLEKGSREAYTHPREIVEDIDSIRMLAVRHFAQAAVRGRASEDDADLPLRSRQIVRGVISCIGLATTFCIALVLARVVKPTMPSEQPPDSPRLSHEAARGVLAISEHHRFLEEAEAFLRTKGINHVEVHVRFQKAMLAKGMTPKLAEFYRELEPRMRKEIYAYLRTRLLPEAERERAYREIIAENPSFAWAYASLGALLGNKGDHLGAHRKYQCALRLEPDNPRFLSGLGYALLVQEEHAGILEAERIFEKLCEESSDLRQQYGKLACELRLERPQALQRLEAFVEAHPKHVWANRDLMYYRRLLAPPHSRDPDDGGIPPVPKDAVDE